MSLTKCTQQYCCLLSDTTAAVLDTALLQVIATLPRLQNLCLEGARRVSAMGLVHLTSLTCLTKMKIGDIDDFEIFGVDRDDIYEVLKDSSLQLQTKVGCH